MTYNPKADDRLVTLHAPCYYCKHLVQIGTQGPEFDEWTCTAFPTGIPHGILTRSISHTEPLPTQAEGEEETVYEPSVFPGEPGDPVFQWSFEGEIIEL